MPGIPFNSETGREAGRKSKRGVTERIKWLNELLKDDKAKAVFAQLEGKAMAGDMDAIKTYLGYCFGKPEGKIDFTSDGESIVLNGFRPKENAPILNGSTNGHENFPLNGNSS